MVSAVGDYIQLLRPRYHLLYLTVIVAAVFFGSLSFPLTLFRLAELYVSFCVFLYGGLYTINAIGDKNIDAAHPRKRSRPVAAGRIGVRAAWIYAVSLLLLALVSGAFFFGMPVLVLYFFFLIVNLLYTYVLKHIPYVELLGNSLTYPLRALLGIQVTQGYAPPSLLLAIFFFALGWATTRRIIEKERGEESGRPTLRSYTLRSLASVNAVVAIALLALWAANADAYGGWYALLFAAHCALAFLRTRVAFVRMTTGWLLS